MRAIDGTSFLNISATTAPFRLLGGFYGVDVVMAGTSVKLQKQCADGTTYVSVNSATPGTTGGTATMAGGTDFTASGYGIAEVPEGWYRLTLLAATGVYATIRRIPEE